MCIPIGWLEGTEFGELEKWKHQTRSILSPTASTSRSDAPWAEQEESWSWTALKCPSWIHLPFINHFLSFINPLLLPALLCFHIPRSSVAFSLTSSFCSPSPGGVSSASFQTESPPRPWLPSSPLGSSLGRDWLSAWLTGS